MARLTLYRMEWDHAREQMIRWFCPPPPPRSRYRVTQEKTWEEDDEVSEIRDIYQIELIDWVIAEEFKCTDGDYVHGRSYEQK